MKKWLQVRRNKVRLILEADFPPNSGEWHDQSKYNPLPQVGWVYDEIQDSFSPPPAEPELPAKKAANKLIGIDWNKLDQTDLGKIIHAIAIALDIKK